MSISFNPDGSIRLPGQMQEKKDEDQRMFDSGRVIRFNRRAVSDAPLIDELDVQFSRHIENPSQIEGLFVKAKGLFRHDAQISMERIDEQEYRVRIISGQYRDSWLAEFRGFLAECMGARVQYRGNGNDFRKAKY